MPKNQFDAEAFYAVLDAQRQSKGLTWKEVAQKAGVSASTLTRMAQGKRPDVDTTAALLAWSGLSMDSFVKRDSKDPDAPDTLTTITAYLRADPHLTPEGAAALEAIVKAGYEKLRKDSEK